MEQQFLHSRRGVATLGAAALLAVLWLTPGLQLWDKTIATVLGLALGLLSGALTWRQIRRRIFAGNRVILYYTDTFAYALVVAAGLATVFPGPALRAAASIGSHPTVVLALILATASSGLGMSLTLYLQLRRHEARSGPLLAKTYYAQSTTGAEGMLGQRAVVETECAPEGTVRLGGELWQARSSRDITLRPGEEVVVRDVDGLCLWVEHEDIGAA